ncbi:NADH dehydrogenase [Arcticibacter tournemirensis]|uniref:NADH:ubiquinone reductase (non-electrogenic) n=1 Tax=Arcticibacter tournemirensis TaxID=699437 RepID=A0A5M9GSC6_9SPHI|nr:NAD(P)/FAD-dependent oxidoreductase [Arcticibacter tournemirensis]KAA8475714.1 NAD(P)/FAD-dependent oxidoreductase [Arcticibacter tournemirensis]TQM52311.1 NADH dehydrogenase [Arcticibacter tournemirensis]
MKVIIIGAGFAGLDLARKLNNKEGIEVLLIDKLTYHQFQPLFYQVATSALEPSSISFPIRKVFQKSKNTRIRISEVKAIHSEKNEVETDTGVYRYDALVIATGATTNYFGNDKIASKALPMKSTLEAVKLKNRLINNFEDALDIKDPVSRRKYLTVVIAGAGPTGVELAGALSEMRKNMLPKDYPELDFRMMDIYLLDGLDRPLFNMSAESSADAVKYLDQLGIIQMMKTTVKDYDGENVLLADGNVIQSKTLIWAAGVKGAIPSGIEPDVVIKGRIKVDRFNKVFNTRNIYAIGDIATMETPLYPKGHPQLASVAKAQGKHLAENLIRFSKAENMTEFEFQNKGTMATIARGMGVVDMEKPVKTHLNGVFAWITWMLLHASLLYGGKNRIIVFINWLYKLFSFDQTLRLAERHHTIISDDTIEKIKNEDCLEAEAKAAEGRDLRS